MGLYRRRGSPFWWMNLAALDGRGDQRSTKIHADAPSKEQRAELKRQAEAVYRRAQAELTLQLTGVEKPAITLRDYLAWYAQHVAARHRGAARETEILAGLERAFGPHTRLSAITKERVVEWQTDRLADVSYQTVNRETDVLKRVLAEAVPTYLEASPIAGLRRLRPPPGTDPIEIGVLSPTDERKLLDVLAPADQAIVLLALDTLVRAGDLLALKWSDVKDTHLVIRLPKSGTAYRAALSARCKAALARVRRKGPYVFHHRRSASTERLQANGLKSMLEDACARAGVKYGRKIGGITFHGLRHTGTTRMVSKGASLETIRRQGGWSSLRMLSRYAHPDESLLAAAAELVGADVPPATVGVHSRKSRKNRPV